MSNPVRLLICAEGGPQIGFGHVRRCLSLAAALRQQGAKVSFLSNEDPAVTQQVSASDFEVIPANPDVNAWEAIEQSRRQNAAIVVVDSYNFDTDDFRALMQAGPLVVALDDTAAIQLPVHMVINGSAGAECLRYVGLKDTQFVLGTQYVLLRPEFARDLHRVIADRVRRVLITVGGSDPHNLTPQLMKWTCQTLGAIDVDVIVGPLFENTAEIERAKLELASPIVLHFDPKDVRSLMLEADLAISGGGQTTYELAAAGTPTIAIRLSNNQTLNLQGLSDHGALIWAGDADDDDLGGNTQRAISSLAAEPYRRAELSKQGRALVDGFGSVRVGRAILQLARN